MAPPPDRTELADTYPNPTNAVFKSGIGKLWDYVTGLLGLTGDPAEARAALGAVGSEGFTMTGQIVFATGDDIASAATVDLTGATGNIVSITGTTGITAWTMDSGQLVDIRFAGVLTLTHHATNNNLPGGVNITTAAGDRARLFYDGTTVVMLYFVPAALVSQAVAEAGTDTEPRLWSALRVRQAVNANKSFGTPVSASGTLVDFTSIPSWVKRITITLSGVSLSGTSGLRFQLGDSGGLESTGYLGGTSQLTSTVGTSNPTAGFDSTGAVNASSHHGSITFTLVEPSTNTWAAVGIIALSDTARTILIAGSKSLSAVLDRVRITTLNGTDTFDAGTINYIFEG